MQLFQAFRKKFAGNPSFYPVKVRKRIENLNKFFQKTFRQIVPIDT